VCEKPLAECTSDAEAQPTPSRSMSTKHFLDMTTDEWLDHFTDAANKDLPQLLERRRMELEAYYDEVERQTGLPRATPRED
jgi:hypothetical protein